MNKRTIYINALLKDNMIIAWRISPNLREFPHDYYKDFYYNDTPMFIETVDDEYKAKYMSVEIDDNISNEFNDFIFEKLAKEYYKQWRVHPKHFGQAAY